MPHPIELLESIKTKLLNDYPEKKFRYEFERRLPEVNPQRMEPDLIIRDLVGRVVCLVEIGYTRPEKLRRYRELGIIDVRWYSKAGELMDGYREVFNVLRHVPSKLETFYYTLLPEKLECPVCWEKYLSEEDDEEGNKLSEEEAFEESRSATYTHCWISDNNRGVAISFCDECEHVELHYSGVGMFLENPLMELDYKDLSHFLYRHDRLPKPMFNNQCDLGDLILSTRRQNWDPDYLRECPLPPTKCSFESIEAFVKYWFGEEFQFQYERMAPIEWELAS